MLSKAEFRGATLAVAGMLVVVYLLVSFSPGLPGELLLQTLRFHLVAAGIGIGVLAMLLGARIRGALFLAIVLASAVHGALVVRELYERRTEVAGDPVARFSFLSFNVLADNPQAERLVDTVLADPPDVMLVMETPGVEEYRDRIRTALPYSLGCDNSPTCDISLYSRFPLEWGEVQKLPPFGKERLVVARVNVDGQDVTIAGLHLSKPYFDHASLEELWFTLLAIRKIEGPMVIAGDFNAAPWSEPMALLTNRLSLVPGPWPAATWPVRLGALGVPIDNVFTRGGARVLSLEAGDSLGSNHRPLLAEVALYDE
jgi:endonuclease/exonuclease/phosphatase (EEP) superfamily protein YafD